MYLDFQGTRAEGVLLTLLLGVSAVLCVWSGMQFSRGNRRAGWLSLAAAGGPATAAAGCFLDAGWGFWRNDAARTRRSLVAGLFALLLTAVVGVLWERSGVSGAFRPAMLLAHVTIATGLIYASTYRVLGFGRFAVLLALRLVAVWALLLILFKPVLIVPADAETAKPTLAVLLDRSGSMGTRDQPDSPSRYTQAVEMLLSQAQRIGGTYSSQWFDFAKTAGALCSAEEFLRRTTTGPETTATDITAGLQQAGKNQPGAGVILLSDGAANTPGDPATVAESLHVPVYVVAVGSTDSPAPHRANLQLLRVDAPLQAAAGHDTTLTAQIRLTRLANVQTRVRFFAGDSTTPLAVETISTAQNDVTLPVKFTWRPDKNSSDADHRVALRLRVDANPAEHTTEDNEIEFHVAITEPTIRVLYIEGVVRPEYKYLRRLLQGDPNVQFAGLVRIGGNRFWSQGRLDGTVLKGLPTSNEDFHRFDVLILGDLDSSFLGAERMGRIRRFVADGGGLLMLGGQSSFGPGGYDGSEVTAALPVVVGGRNAPQGKGAFLPQLTAPGAEHPIFSGIAGYFLRGNGAGPDATLPPLPKLQGCVSVPRAKSGAAILAVHPTRRNEAGPLIVLAVEQFGAGRSAAMTADTTWRWYLPMRALAAKSPYARFWGQLIRWLAGAGAIRRRDGTVVVLRAERTCLHTGAKPTRLLAYVRNTSGAPAEKTRASVTLSPTTKTKTEPTSILLKPTDSPGLFEGQIAPTESGEFVLKLKAENEKNETIGTDELPIRVLPQSTEREQVARNDTLLRAIADRSGGKFVELVAFPNLLDALLSRQRLQADPPPEAKILRLYHFPSLFILFTLLLTAEWALRRTWQLR